MRRPEPAPNDPIFVSISAEAHVTVFARSGTLSVYKAYAPKTDAAHAHAHRILLIVASRSMHGQRQDVRLHQVPGVLNRSTTVVMSGVQIQPLKSLATGCLVNSQHCNNLDKVLQYVVLTYIIDKYVLYILLCTVPT